MVTVKLEVLITSGGTAVPIDDVRHIGNFSGGTTGAMIAEEFLRQGAIVHYVYAKGAKRPYRRDLEVNPDKDKESELERVSKKAEEYADHKDRLHEYRVDSFDEYYGRIKELLTTKQIGVAVLAAAVSDYGVQKTDGKISSDNETVTLELHKLPKIISEVKKWKPDVYLVGFKFLPDAPIDELVETAYRHGLKNRSDLTVANTSPGLARKIVLITPERGLYPVGQSEFPKRLVDMVYGRFSKKHYRTAFVSGGRTAYDMHGRLRQAREEMDDAGQTLSQLNLFFPYYDGAHAEFGFIAKRMGSGFLITGRGSRKSSLSPEEIIYVPKVDFKSREVCVDSDGKKASLNANVAGKIFSTRTDADWVVHAHIGRKRNPETVDPKNPWPIGPSGRRGSPGTEEDMQWIDWYVNRGCRSIDIRGHGIFLTGKDLDEVVGNIGENHVYSSFADLYDIVYARFSHPSLFIDLVRENVGKGSRILDLACGTGSVGLELLLQGWHDVSLSDGSDKMLSCARIKLAGNGHIVPMFNSRFEEMRPKMMYDAILIRQAMNYLSTKEKLIAGLTGMRAALRPDGRLIFNAPNYHRGDEYPDVDMAYEHDGYLIRGKEMNLVEDRMLTHTLRCELMKTDGSAIIPVYDLNRFGLFTKEEFGGALVASGFHGIRMIEEGRSLYCIAER